MKTLKEEIYRKHWNKWVSKIWGNGAASDMDFEEIKETLPHIFDAMDEYAKAALEKTARIRKRTETGGYTAGIYIIRLIGLPFYIGLVSITLIKLLCLHAYYWVIHGGEAVAYVDKHERKTIYEVYKEVKHLRNSLTEHDTDTGGN